MEEKHENPQDPEVDNTEVHKGQNFFDKTFLLLALSILITGLIYTTWGLLELFR